MGILWLYSHYSRTIKPGLGVGAITVKIKEIYLWQKQGFIHNIYNNDLTTIKLVLSLQLRWG
jgi:hypothetical protein